MKISELIKILEKKNPDKEITVMAPNGLLLIPSVKLVLKDKGDILNHGDDNIEKYVIIYQ